MAESKPNVSKHILDRAAFIFIRHPGQAFTRKDIQNLLGISKSTTSRILSELTEVLNLEENMEGQTKYYLLSDDERQSLYKTLDFILAFTDRERLALNFMLHSYGEYSIFKDTIINLEEKFNNAGLLSYSSDAIRESNRNVQNISDDNKFLIDTLLNSLETKTKIRVDYQAVLCDEVKTHDLWPVGLYMRDGNLYLYAYSPRFLNATSYAYSRMKSIDYLYDEHYEIPDGINMDELLSDPFGIAITAPRKVKVKVMNKQVFYEKEKKWPNGTVITDLEDGSIRMEFNISDPYAFRTWVLSLGRDAMVEEPAEYVDWIRWEHREALENYGEPSS